MTNILKKYLLIPLFILIGELGFDLVSKHIMQSEPYLMVQKSIDDFMLDKSLASFTSSKTSYKAHENIEFNIELNKKSHLYLLTLKEKNQACLLFPTAKENNVFKEGKQTLSSSSLKTSQTQTGLQEFILLASKEALVLSGFENSSCMSRNDGLMVIQKLEENGAESLGLDVRVN